MMITKQVILFFILIPWLVTSQSKKAKSEIYSECLKNIVFFEKDGITKAIFSVSDSLLVVSKYYFGEYKINRMIPNEKVLESLGGSQICESMIAGLKSKNNVGLFEDKKLQKKVGKMNSNNSEGKCNYRITFSKITLSKDKKCACLLVRKLSECMMDYTDIYYLKKTNNDWIVLDFINLN